VAGLQKAAEMAGTPATINRIGSMFTVFFTSTPVADFQTAKTSDTVKYSRFFHALLKQGIYFPPSQFEACFVSAVHTGRDISTTIQAAREAFKAAAG